MNKPGRTIVKNVSVMLVAQVITWALGFIYAIFLPSYIGAENSGKYAIALSVWAIMAMVVNTGVTTHLTKEVARNPQRATDLFSTALIQRHLFFLLACGVIFFYSQVANYDPDVIVLLWIVAFTQPLWQTLGVINAVFQGLEVMHHISVVEITSKLLTVGLSFLCMFLKLGIFEIASVSVIVSLVAVVVQMLILRRYISLRIAWNTPIAIDLLKASVPYFLSGLVVTLYFEVDNLIMSQLVDESVIGWYSVATSLNATFLFLPGILTTAVFPALTRNAAGTSDGSSILFRKSFDIMLLVGIPVGLGLSAIAQPLILLVYKESFAPSGLVLQVMSIVLILTYLTTLLGRFIIAADRTNTWTFLIFVCALLTLPLDFALIPWFQRALGNGGVGGAVSFAITELLMVVVGILLMPKGTFTWANVSFAARTALAGFVMMVMCWTVRDMFIIVPILTGMVTYVVMVALLRIIPREDLEFIWSAAQSLYAKLRPRHRDVVPAGEV